MNAKSLKLLTTERKIRDCNRTFFTGGVGYSIGEKFFTTRYRPVNFREKGNDRMRLSQSEVFRLYSVAEYLNEEEMYLLESFDNDAFNEDIDAGELGEALNRLAKATYGQDSRWYEIIHDYHDGKGKVCIKIDDDDRLEVQDIAHMVDGDCSQYRYHILVNAQLSDYRWVVAIPEGTVYSGYFSQDMVPDHLVGSTSSLVEESPPTGMASW